MPDETHSKKQNDYSDLVDALDGYSRDEIRALWAELPQELRPPPHCEGDHLEDLRAPSAETWAFAWGRAYERRHGPPPRTANIIIAVELAIAAADLEASAMPGQLLPEALRSLLGRLRRRPGWQERLRAQAARLHQIGRPPDEPLPPWRPSADPPPLPPGTLQEWITALADPPPPSTEGHRRTLTEARRMVDEICRSRATPTDPPQGGHVCTVANCHRAAVASIPVSGGGSVVLCEVHHGQSSQPEPAPAEEPTARADEIAPGKWSTGATMPVPAPSQVSVEISGADGILSAGAGGGWSCGCGQRFRIRMVARPNEEASGTD